MKSTTSLGMRVQAIGGGEAVHRRHDIPQIGLLPGEPVEGGQLHRWDLEETPGEHRDLLRAA